MHKNWGLACALALVVGLSGCGAGGEVKPKGGLLHDMVADHAKGAAAPSGSTAASGDGATRGTVLGADKSAVTFDRLTKMPEPGWNVPRKAVPARDGKLVTFLASESGELPLSV
jgi:dipeptidyl-peptidase 4